MKLVPLIGAAAAWWFAPHITWPLTQLLVPPQLPTGDDFDGAGGFTQAQPGNIGTVAVVGIGLRAGAAYLAYRALS